MGNEEGKNFKTHHQALNSATILEALRVKAEKILLS